MVGRKAVLQVFSFLGDYNTVIMNPRYCEEIRVFKAGVSLNTSAWNNTEDAWLLVIHISKY